MYLVTPSSHEVQVMQQLHPVAAALRPCRSQHLVPRGSSDPQVLVKPWAVISSHQRRRPMMRGRINPTLMIIPSEIIGQNQFDPVTVHQFGAQTNRGRNTRFARWGLLKLGLNGAHIHAIVSHKFEYMVEKHG